MGSGTLPINILGQVTGSADMQKAADAMEKLANSIDQAGKKTESANPQFDKFAKSVGDFIRNPLQAAGNAAENFLKSIGPMGGAVAAGATAAGAFAAAVFGAAKSLGEYGIQLQATSLRTGLSIVETEHFGVAAKMAGGDITYLETAMRRLSVGLDDTNEKGKTARQTLHEMGIKTKELDGSIRPTSEILLDLSRRFNEISDPTLRGSKAMDIFSRAGITLLPTILGLTDNLKRAKEIGFAPDQKEIEKMLQYHRTVVELETLWERLVRAIKQPIAGLITIELKTLVSGGAPKPTGEYSNPTVEAIRQWMLGNTGSIPPPTAPGIPQTGFAQMNGQEIAKGNSILARFRESEKMNLDSLERLYAEAKKKAEEARQALLGAEGTGAKNVQEKEQAYRLAERALEPLKEELEYLKKIEELRKRLAIFVYQEKSESSDFARQTIPTLYGRMTSALANIPPSQRGGTFYTSNAAINEANAESDRSIWAQASAYLDGLKEAQERRKALADAALDHQIKMVELLTGPGGEVQAIITIANLRLASAKTAIDKQQILNDMEEKLAGLQKARIDSYVSAVQGGFRALVSGGRSGLSSFFTSQLTGMAEIVVGNIARMSYPKIQEMMTGMGLNAKEGSFAGKLLAGTPFGANPLDRAGTTLITAGMSLQMAASHLMMVGGGGVAGTASSMIQKFDQQGNPIFSAFQSFGNTTPSSYNQTFDSGGNPTFPAFNTDYWTNANGGPTTGGDTQGSGFNTASAVRYGGGSAAAAFSAYRMFKASNTKGKLSAGGDTAMSVGAMLPPPAGPIVMAAGMAMKLAAAIMGDPKQIRAKQLQEEAASRAFTEPLGMSYSTDIYGSSVSSDAWNRTRPMIVNNGTLVNGNVNAMDAGSFVDWSKKNSAAIAESMTHSVASGNAEDFVGTMRPLMS